MGAYFEFFLDKEGLNGEGGLIERGGLIELLQYFYYFGISLMPFLSTLSSVPAKTPYHI